MKTPLSHQSDQSNYFIIYDDNHVVIYSIIYVFLFMALYLGQPVSIVNEPQYL